MKLGHVKALTPSTYPFAWKGAFTTRQEQPKGFNGRLCFNVLVKRGTAGETVHSACSRSAQFACQAVAATEAWKTWLRYGGRITG